MKSTYINVIVIASLLLVSCFVPLSLLYTIVARKLTQTYFQSLESIRFHCFKLYLIRLLVSYGESMMHGLFKAFHSKGKGNVYYLNKVFKMILNITIYRLAIHLCVMCIMRQHNLFYSQALESEYSTK